MGDACCGHTSRPVRLLMDCSSEGNSTRQLAFDLGFLLVVPPIKTRLDPWEYGRAMYMRRNEVGRSRVSGPTQGRRHLNEL